MYLGLSFPIAGNSNLYLQNVMHLVREGAGGCRLYIVENVVLILFIKGLLNKTLDVDSKFITFAKVAQLHMYFLNYSRCVSALVNLQCDSVHSAISLSDQTPNPLQTVHFPNGKWYFRVLFANWPHYILLVAKCS